MLERGQIEIDVAKRALYPRAYWEVFRDAAERRNLDPSASARAGSAGESIRS